MTIGLTALLALLTGVSQTLWPILKNDTFHYFATWVVTAVLSVLLISFEMRKRTKRHHGGFADEMLLAAAGNFLPAGVVGFFLLVAFSIFAVDLVWLLPSIWLLLVGLGVLASIRILPPILNIGGAIYIILGFATFLFSVESRTLSPWLMACPFAIGQSVLAFLLFIAWRKPR